MVESHTVAPISDSSSVVHPQQPPSFQPPETKTVEPNTNSSTASQSPPFQPAKSPSITPISETKATSATAIPTTDINQDLIWQKAIALVHPPTTRTLLSQKCHLVSINGSMVTIGVVSPPLIKLIQAKIANIETAFTQACQRKIKVTLEVAKNTPPSATHNSSPSPSNPQLKRNSQLPKLETETITAPENIPASNLQSPTPTSPPAKPQTKPVVTHDIKRSPIENQESPLQVTTSDFSAITDTQNPTAANEQINIHNQNVIANAPSKGDFQKAVELLAKSFDGEVISLGNAEENLPSEETSTSNDLNYQTHQEQSIAQPATPIRNRPDLTMYEDDDNVPF